MTKKKAAKKKSPKKRRVPQVTAPVNYETIEIPKDKPTQKYTVVERRAHLYRKMKDAAHPDDIGSYRELGEFYGMSGSTIFDDKQIILKWYGENMMNKHVEKVGFRYEKIVNILMKSNNLNSIAQASKVMTDWNAFFFNVGKQNKVADKHEHSGEFSQNFAIEVTEFKKVKK